MAAGIEFMNRNWLNLTMTIGLLGAMDYRFTENAVHEIAGVVTVLLFFIHNVLNYRWYGVMMTGKMSFFRLINTATNLLLMLMLTCVTASGVLISQTVFASLSLSGHLWVHQLHTFSAYASLILCGIHLGLHWSSIYGKLCHWLGIDATDPRYIVPIRVVSLMIVSYGIYVSFSRQIGAKLMLEHLFGGWGAAKPSLLGFVLDYPAVLGCYAVIAHYCAKRLRKIDRNL